MPADAAPSFLYLPDLPPGDEPFELPRDEAHYLTRVCRACAGDRAHATDGAGTLARLSLLEVGARTRARVESRTREPASANVTLLCGAPESGRGDWMVEKLAELGVTRFQPVDCERGSWRAAEARRGRWERVAIAALRQSMRVRRMEIGEPRSLAAAVAELANADRWIADPAGPQASERRADASVATAGLVGPSGGFSDRERETLAAIGWKPLALATARLRTETAAVAWAAWRAMAAVPASRAPEGAP